MACYSEAVAGLEEEERTDVEALLDRIEAAAPEICENVRARENKLDSERFAEFLRNLLLCDDGDCENAYRNGCRATDCFGGETIDIDALPSHLHRFVNEKDVYAALASQLGIPSPAQALRQIDNYKLRNEEALRRAFDSIDLAPGDVVWACFSLSEQNDPAMELGDDPLAVRTVIGKELESDEPPDLSLVDFVYQTRRACDLTSEEEIHFPTVVEGGWNQHFRPAVGDAAWGITMNGETGSMEVPADGEPADPELGLPEVIHHNRRASICEELPPRSIA